MAWTDNLTKNQLARYKAGTLTQGQQAKTKEKEKAEAAFRAYEDQRLESLGLLDYQQAGYIPGVGLPGGFGGLSADYTVTEGDNLNTIAEANKTTPENILSFNPDIDRFKTGLVIKVPSPIATQNAVTTQIQGEKFVMPAPGGPVGGMPSNSVSGQLTNNPQGVNAGQQQYAQANPTDYNAGMQAYSQSISQQSVARTLVGAGGANPFRKYEKKVPGTGIFSQGNLPGSYRTIGPQGPQQFSQPALALNGQPLNSPTAGAGYVNNTTYQSQAAVRGMPNYTKSNLASKRAYEFTTLMERINNTDYVPTENQINILIEQGYMAKGSYASAGGGGGYYGPSGIGGGGGGGGQKTNSSGLYPTANRPQFASQAGFRGLINWRI